MDAVVKVTAGESLHIKMCH